MESGAVQELRGSIAAGVWRPIQKFFVYLPYNEKGTVLPRYLSESEAAQIN